MQVRVEVDCTPEEARTFLGLPNITPFNDKLVEEMTKRMQANSAALQPEEMLRTWMNWGGQAQEQFRNLMKAAVAQAGTPAAPPKTPKKDG